MNENDIYSCWMNERMVMIAWFLHKLDILLVWNISTYCVSILHTNRQAVYWSIYIDIIHWKYQNSYYNTLIWHKTQLLQTHSGPNQAFKFVLKTWKLSVFLISIGNLFHSFAASNLKELSPYIVVFILGNMSLCGSLDS